MNTTEIKLILESEIPISKAMQFEIKEVSQEIVKILMPLSINKNHKGTAFGGSLFAGCALAAYTQVLSQLDRHGYSTKDIVVAESTIRYKKPLRDDFEVVCIWPLAEQQTFFNQMEKKQHAQVWLTCWIVEKNQEPKKETICADFLGRFVVKKTSN